VNSGHQTRLVLRAQTGDHQALNDLFLEIQPSLLRFLISFTGNATTAEDLLQDVLFLVYLKVKWLKDPSLFRPWCYRIATRHAIKYLQKQKGWKEIGMPDSSLADVVVPEKIELSKTEIEFLRTCVGDLPPACRIVVVLHYIQEMPLTEIALILGISTGTVKSRLNYGLNCLRRMLSDRKDQR